MTKQDIVDWHKAHPYGARDEAYVDAVLAEVKQTWLEFPSERLGQLIENFAGETGAFMLHDEEWFDD